MITDQHRQEQLSRAYMHAVAAHAGLIFESTTVDYGVDGTLRGVTERNGRRLVGGHSIDVQLKATTDWICRGDNIVYELEAKTYNDLVDRFNEPRGTPMVLVVLCLPKDEKAWLGVSHDQLILRHCCYWCRLGGSRTDNTASKTIEVPRANILDPAAVSQLLDRVALGIGLP
jgi:hypothetical protein